VDFSIGGIVFGSQTGSMSNLFPQPRILGFEFSSPPRLIDHFSREPLNLRK